MALQAVSATRLAACSLALPKAAPDRCGVLHRACCMRQAGAIGSDAGGGRLELLC